MGVRFHQRPSWVEASEGRPVCDPCCVEALEGMAVCAEILDDGLSVWLLGGVKELSLIHI